MPRVALIVTASLRNVALLEPRGGINDEEMKYYFKLECERCGWVSEEEVCVKIKVQERAPVGSRRMRHVNMSAKCDGCERPGVIKLVPGHGRPLSEGDLTDVPLMVFDCDGLLPIHYSFNGGWSAITKSGNRIFPNLVEKEYSGVVDGEYIEIKMNEAKFVPYNA